MLEAYFAFIANTTHKGHPESSGTLTGTPAAFATTIAGAGTALVTYDSTDTTSLPVTSPANSDFPSSTFTVSVRSGSPVYSLSISSTPTLQQSVPSTHPVSTQRSTSGQSVTAVPHPTQSYKSSAHASIASAASSITDSSTSLPQSDISSHHGTDVTAIVGGVIGGIAGLSILAVLILWWIQRTGRTSPRPMSKIDSLNDEIIQTYVAPTPFSYLASPSSRPRPPLKIHVSLDISPYDMH